MSGDVDSPIPIAMPRLSDQMEEAIIVRWLCDSGEAVAKGDEIVEIETDKASVNYESEYSGVLEIVAQPGESVALNDQIAVIHPPGTDVSSVRSVTDTYIEGDTSGQQGPIEAPVADNPPPLDGLPAAPVRGEGRLFASPLVRRLAREMGLDLDGVSGSGPRGRIVRKDLDEILVAQSQPMDPPVSDSRIHEQIPVFQEPVGDVSSPSTMALTPRQRLVAERMVEAKRSAPEFAASIDVDMTELSRWRARLKEIERVPPSYNDFMVKAVASAVRIHPRLNSIFTDGGTTITKQVNVGIAVDHEGDLLVPVIDDVGSLSLGDIADTSRKLIAAVRSGSVTPEQLSGGTITISNLGMYGVKSFQAILNAHQAAIIAFGAIERRVVPCGDDMEIRDIVTVTVTADHRIIYGAEVGDFLGELRRLLEEPILLFL